MAKKQKSVYLSQAFALAWAAGELASLIAAIRESLEHWYRMRVWVLKQPKANAVDYQLLLKSINESVGEHFCALCQFVRKRAGDRKLDEGESICLPCPLDPGALKVCCPEYHKVRDQIIWGGWVKAADKLIARLERELEAALAYQKKQQAKRVKKS